MKKLLFLLHLPPPVHGSSMVGKQIHDLVLGRGDWNPTFININTSSSSAEIGRVGTRKIALYFRLIFRVLSALRNRPETVYFAITVSGGGLFKDLGFVVLIKLFRRRVIYHLHNKGVANRGKHWLYRLIYSWVFKNSRVVLLSNELYLDVAPFVRPDQVDLCPNGVPDTAGRSLMVKKMNDVPLILFLSNLIESKGIGVLLEACAELAKQGILFKVDFVGGEADWTSEYFYQQIGALGLADRVRYRGRLIGADKDSAFAMADIFCLPTFYHNECMPLVLLEAMQWGIPCVSTFEGAIPSVIVDGETGFLVPQRDVRSLVFALRNLLSDPVLRTRMGNGGRARFEQRFSVDNFNRRILDIFDKCLVASNHV